MPSQSENSEEKWDEKLLEKELRDDEESALGKAYDILDQDLTSPAIDEIESDTTLLVNFQERSLREFFRGAAVREKLRTPALFSQLDLFGTTIELLCGTDEHDPIMQEARVGLRGYAAFSWVKHFLDLSEDDIKADQTKLQVIAVTESLFSITTNQNNASDIISQHSPVCYDDFAEPLDTVPQKIQEWAERYLACTEFNLQSHTMAWAKKIILNPADVLQPLTRGHVTRWFNQRLKDPAMEAYKLALKAFKTVCSLLGPDFLSYINILTFAIPRRKSIKERTMGNRIPKQTRK